MDIVRERMKRVLKRLVKRGIGIDNTLRLLALRERLMTWTVLPLQRALLLRRLARIPVVTAVRGAGTTDVDAYWGNHTIWTTTFLTAQRSLDYVRTIDRLYPLYFEYCGLYEEHKDEVILEYGCGPGNDVVGWAVFSKARKIVAMDISRKALELARQRVALHDVDAERLEFVQISDEEHQIPLPDGSVDYINCLGVLHHTSQPDAIMKEFFRVLAPGGRATIMVYHWDSIYVNLSIAYELQIMQGQYPGLSAVEGFYALADGRAPIARLHRADEFAVYCQSFDFETTYMGAAFSQTELDSWKRCGRQAMEDTRLGPAHRSFLSELVEDARGFPMRDGMPAGLDAVFRLVKP